MTKKQQPITMYNFHCGFRADKQLLSSQKRQWGTTGIHPEIRNANLYSPLCLIQKGHCNK
jgi:hypothetical protein